jgi:hypothetical protein
MEKQNRHQWLYLLFCLLLFMGVFPVKVYAYESVVIQQVGYLEILSIGSPYNEMNPWDVSSYSWDLENSTDAQYVRIEDPSLLLMFVD